ncbi:MAG: hypothetical protein JWM90_3115 [Thermoleophilia bacterium]|nr:hypothetical protein [Thermoleophilia bacterium]
MSACKRDDCAEKVRNLRGEIERGQTMRANLRQTFNEVYDDREELREKLEVAERNLEGSRKYARAGMMMRHSFAMATALGIETNADFIRNALDTFEEYVGVDLDQEQAA